MEEAVRQVEGMQISRYFTTGRSSPYSEVVFEKRSSVIRNPDGSVVAEINDVEVPIFWSQVATDILAQKYFRKAGVLLFDTEGKPVLDASGKQATGSENSVRQVIDRLVGCWRFWGERYGYFSSSEDAQAFEDELRFMLLHQYAAPNSPQWFNTGLNWAYGITGPSQGHCYVDPDSKELTYSKDAYTHPAPHACFIQSVSDDLINEGGIFDLLTREARVFKYGSGCTSGDSFVFTDKFGLIKIRDLYAKFAGDGRKVSDFDGRGKYLEVCDADVYTFSVNRQGEFKKDRIDRVWSYDVSKEDKLTVTLNNGTKLTTSAWHPFLVWDGERVTTKRTDALKRGDAVIGPNSTLKPLLEKFDVRISWETTYFRKAEHHEVTVDADLAWLIGYFMGDGSLGEYTDRVKSYVYTRNRLRFHDQSVEVLEKARKILLDKFDARSSIRLDKGSKGMTLQCLNRRATGFFQRLFGVGSKVYRLKLPDFIVKLGVDGIAAFLAGLVDSDGYVTEDGKAVYSSASRDFSSQVAVLASLLNCGGGTADERDVRSVTVVHKSCIPENAEVIARHMTNKLRRERIFASIFRSHRTQYCMPVTKQALAKAVPLPSSPSGMLGVNVGGTTFHLGRVEYEGIVNPRKLSLMLSKTLQSQQAVMLSRIAESLCFVSDVQHVFADVDFYDLTVHENNNYLAGEGAFAVIHNTGSNFSALRAEGERLSGGGRSSGLMSFLKIYDRAAGAIKSGGTTRRAAKMVILDVDHPDVEQFINWKVKEEEKVVALVAGSKHVSRHLRQVVDIAMEEKTTRFDQNARLARAVKDAVKASVPVNYISRVLKLVEQGVQHQDFPVFDTHFESEAYVTVSGQNSNNTVRVSNKFLDAAANNADWNLVYRTTGKVARTIKAGELWNRVAYAAWASADPGLQYDDTINEWHTCPVDGRINASNPCSEFMFLDNSACNLASLNLAKFYNPDTGLFDVQGFKHAIRLWTVVLEISVLMAQFVSRELADVSYKFRPLGLGYANLGSLLMQLALPYDSDEARAISGALTAILTGEAYATSADMAKRLGAFEGFARNREHMLKVIRNHRRAAYNAKPEEYESLSITPKSIDETRCPKYLVEAARECWDRALALGEPHGYRNAQVSVLAPTGTIGLVLDCDTTGVEPDFALVKFKKLAGGGYFKIVNQAVPNALKRLGYSEQQVKEIEDYCKGKGTLKGCPAISLENLKQKGFTDENLSLVEKLLPNAFDLRFVFNKWVVGEDCLKTLGFSAEQYNAKSFDLLAELGFTKQQIDAANDFVCGTMTIEGAPHLRKEHYAVFDCASKCGSRGKRFIAYPGHLKMMAAAQPFITGSISKTINMPAESTVEDVKAAYVDGWKMMLKSVALYRDGSKLSQPLNASSSEADALLLSMEQDVDETVGPKEMQKVALQANVLSKRKLPAKRRGFVQEARVGGHKVFLRTGEYEDGKLGEIFIDMYKEGAAYRSLVNCFAIAVSKALQYGVPLDEFVDAFTYTRFEPAGVVTGHDKIKNASSLLDYVFRVLGCEYLDRQDLAHVKVPLSETFDVSKPLNPAQKTLEDKVIPQKVIKKQGYTGDQCSSCGSMRLRRNGSCMVCEDCGTTTGCS